MVPMLLCVVLDCTGMRLGVSPRLKLSSLSDVSLLLSVELDGKKEEDLFGRLFTAIKKINQNGYVTLRNRHFAASGHMVHAGGQAAHWDIQNKATSSR